MKLVPREYQRTIADAVIKNGNTLVVLPTGLGKTLIGALVFEHFLKQGKKCLFLAPTKPLVDQHVKRLLEYFGETTYKVISITGEINPKERLDLYGTADVIIATPQTVNNDQKKRNIMKNFSCVLVDECHRAVGRYAYTGVAQAAKENGLLIMGLTASPGGKEERIREIMQALYIKHVELRTESEEDIVKYMQEVDIDWIYVDLTKEIKEAVALLEEVAESKTKTLRALGVYVTRKFSRGRLSQIFRQLIENKNFAGLGHFSIFYNAMHGAEVLETEGPYAFGEFVTRLRARKKFVDPRIIQATELVEGLEHPKMRRLVRLVKDRKNKRLIIFAQYRDQVNHIVSVLKENGFKSKRFLGKKGEKKNEQKITIEEFREGKFDILVASSIGEEGIDIPSVDTAIFYEPVPSEIRSIQRRGRVGRTKGGEVIILIAKETRDEAFRWAAEAKEGKMKNIIKKIKSGKIDILKKTGQQGILDFFGKKDSKKE